MAIPVALIAPLRAALQAEGFSPMTVTDQGELNAAGLLSAAFDSVEFRTELTPPVVVTMNSLLDGQPPNPLTSWLKPTVILKGAAGTSTIAPLGVSMNGSWLQPLIAVGGLIGLGYLLGRAK